MDLIVALSRLPTSGLTVTKDTTQSGYYLIAGNLSWDISATAKDVRHCFRGSGLELGDCVVETRDNLPWFRVEVK